MNEEEKKIYYMNRNTKLYPTFCAFTWDVMFVWGISTLFFANQKGLSYSQIIFLDSVLMLAGAFGGLFVPKIFEKINSVISTEIAMCGYGLYLLICIFGNAYWHFVVAQLFLGFGYGIGAIKINRFLLDTLTVCKRTKDYQKLSGKGFSMFYIIDAIGIICISYIYNFSPYLCYWISFGCVIFVMILTLFMRNPEKYMERNFNAVEEQKQDDDSKKTKKKRSGFWSLFKSPFFICLLLYTAIFRGVLFICGGAFKIYMNQLINLGAMPVWLFGYLYAGVRITTALMSKFQFRFDLKFGVRTLILFTTYAILSFIACGAMYLYNMSGVVVIVLITIITFFQCSLRSPNQIFISNYLQICTPKKYQDKAYAIRGSVEYIACAGTSALYSLLMTTFNDNYGLTAIVYISIFAIPLMIALVLFIRVLVKKFAEKYTIIRKEYTED